MTGPSGNRLSICPLRFNRNFWGGDPESLREIDLPITLETSHYLFVNQQETERGELNV